jgi:hypothetical protein
MPSIAHDRLNQMRWPVLLAIGLISAGMVRPQSIPDNPGPAVGARAPEFELPDQNGQRHTLHSLSGPKGLMLVFFRSADW